MDEFDTLIEKLQDPRPIAQITAEEFDKTYNKPIEKIGNDYYIKSYYA